MDDRLIDVALGEFNALVAEVAGRSGAQSALLNLNLVSVGAVGGFVLGADRPPFELALLLAFLCPALAFVWLDHARVIANIGRYLNGRLWPYLRDHMERADLPLREDWVREEERRRTTYFAFHLPLLAVFNVPPVAALVATAGALTSQGCGRCGP